jgi:hypothetical protein
LFWQSISEASPWASGADIADIATADLSSVPVWDPAISSWLVLMDIMMHICRVTGS